MSKTIAFKVMVFLILAGRKMINANFNRSEYSRYPLISLAGDRSSRGCSAELGSRAEFLFRADNPAAGCNLAEILGGVTLRDTWRIFLYRNLVEILPGRNQHLLLWAGVTGFCMYLWIKRND